MFHYLYIYRKFQRLNIFHASILGKEGALLLKSIQLLFTKHMIPDLRRRVTGNLVNGWLYFPLVGSSAHPPREIRIYPCNSFDFIKSNKLSALGISKHFTLPINNAIAACSIYDGRGNEKRGATSAYDSPRNQGRGGRFSSRSLITFTMKNRERRILYLLIETFAVMDNVRRK